MVNFHLKNNSSTLGLGTATSTSPLSVFNLPKLTSNLTENPFLKPKSINSILNLKNLEISESPEKSENWTVDLRSALNVDKTPFIKKTDDKPKVEKEVFVARFIECDIKPILEKNITQHCQIDISSLLKLNVAGRNKIGSKFGRVFCVKYRHKFMPYSVKHEFYPKNKLAPYNFKDMSPDDKTLKHIAMGFRK